tara:strand:- start:37723 stop:38526 length:804 start_codon:yes stop_codon:yes gene_type:complete
MKFIFIFLVLTISNLSLGRLCTPSSQHLKLSTETTKIGIMSAFPKPYGIFFQNRMVYVKDKKRTSLFPDTSQVLFNANDLILRQVTNNLMKKFPEHRIINLGTVDPEQSLTGYFIEGIWGSESQGIHLKNADKLIRENDLDTLVVIVPATYHIPNLGEGTGFGLFYLDKDTAYTYASYAIKVYKKDKSKSVSSNKQVLYNPIADAKQPDLKQKKYTKEILISFKHWLNDKFIPKVSKQIICLLQQAPTACSAEFQLPKKPFGYYLPH